MGGGFSIDFISSASCGPSDTVVECIEKHAEHEGFRSLDAYYWHNQQAQCIVELAEQFEMELWSDLLCDPYKLDGDGQVGEEFNPFCMPDSRRYDVYESIAGCNLCFTVGTGKLQPDAVVFGATGRGEQNWIKTTDIRYNPWSSDDIFRLSFNGENYHHQIVTGNGLCEFPFEIEYGADAPIDNAALESVNMDCRDIALQRTFYDFRICEFLPGLQGTPTAGQYMCDCEHWYDFTTTDQELYNDKGVDEVTVDCSKPFVFDGRSSGEIEKLIFPDGCDNETFVHPNQNSPQKLVIEGELAREVLIDITDLDPSALVVEIVAPHDGSTFSIYKYDMTATNGPFGADDGLRAIRTRTVPAEDEDFAPTYIVSVCYFPGCNRKQVYLEHDFVLDESIEFCFDFGVREEDGTDNIIANGWQIQYPPLELEDGDDTYLGNHAGGLVFGEDGDDYIESKPVRSDFDREIGLTKVPSFLWGREGADTLVSRGGYDVLWGFGQDDEIDSYIIEPTHEVSDHHFEEGCTIIQGLEMGETITLRNEDQSCILEVDAWELLWYIPALDTIEALSSDPPMSAVGSDVTFDITNRCHGEVEVIFWDTNGDPSIYVTLEGENQPGSSIETTEPIGSVFSAQFTDPCVPLIGYDDECSDRTPRFQSAGFGKMYTVVENDDELNISCDHDRHFDVWLTADGRANICENKWSRGGANPARILQDAECGDRKDAICWEWDICGGENDDPHKTAEEQEVDEAFLDWFGGWGNVADTGIVASYDDEIGHLDDQPEIRRYQFWDFAFGD